MYELEKQEALYNMNNARLNVQTVFEEVTATQHAYLQAMKKWESCLDEYRNKCWEFERAKVRARED